MRPSHVVDNTELQISFTAVDRRCRRRQRQFYGRPVSTAVQPRTGPKCCKFSNDKWRRAVPLRQLNVLIGLT